MGMTARRLVLAAGLALCGAGPAVADPPAPTVLHLSQTAERKLTRDLLHVDLRADKTGPDPQSVEAAINQSMAKALARTRQVQGVDVETGSYSVHRDAQLGWTGNQVLALTGSDSEVLLKLAGELQSAGLVMSNLGYEASPKTVHGAEEALTSEALTRLQQRAEAVAAQLHTSLMGYRDLTVGNAQTEGGPMPRLFAAQASTAASMPAPVAAAGEATVRVTVSADVLLAPKQP